MYVGIVAEGASDIAVIRNILKGKLGLEGSESIALRPELSKDETDLAEEKLSAHYRELNPEQYSNNSLVFEECRRRTKIEDFLNTPLDDERLVVVHIDTAEAHRDKGYGFEPPARESTNYFDQMREAVIREMESLLGTALAERVRFAVAIEETEAWLLTIHDTQDRKDTGHRLDPKKRLEHLLHPEPPKAGKSGESFEKSRKKSKARQQKSEEVLSPSQLSRTFCEPQRLEACADRNRSLRLFVDSLALTPR